MVTIIKKGTPAEIIREKLKNLSKRKLKGFNARKYLGILLKSDTDPVSYQKKVRNEWQ